MADIKVGGEVDAYCTRCKLLLAHTVVAIWASQIKRVRCNTCMGEHAYRPAEPGGPTPKALKAPKAARALTPRAAAAERVSASTYETMLAGRDRASARRYSPREQFAPNELVEHPSFGLGVVAAARGLDKIDVAFPAGVKTLLHNKATSPAPLAKPPAPKAPDVELPGMREENPTAETSDE
ncbi:MAG: hypothetical protein ACOX6T_24350 [Myxococcales bacterium]|jgi:hypothetical protein